MRVGGRVIGRIGPGAVVLVGFTHSDGEEQLAWMADKIVGLRIFADDEDKMNRSILESGGELLVVSQFTLYASTRKGNRPSWSRAAPPEIAAPQFDAFVAVLAARLSRPVATGRFGAHMQVALVNDGPVTIGLDSRSRE